MAKSRIRLTRNGPRLLRNVAGVEADLLDRAKRIAQAAGDGMEPSAQRGPNRARGSVITATAEARVAEAQHRALTKAIQAGG